MQPFCDKGQTKQSVGPGGGPPALHQLHSPLVLESASSTLSSPSVWPHFSSSLSSPVVLPCAASNSTASDKLPHIRYTKRRRVKDIPSRERWQCPNDQCKREYKRTSSTSIARHKTTCKWESSTAAYVILDANTRSASLIVNPTSKQSDVDLCRYSRLHNQQAHHPRQDLFSSGHLRQPLSDINRLDNGCTNDEDIIVRTTRI